MSSKFDSSRYLDQLRKELILNKKAQIKLRVRTRAARSEITDILSDGTVKLAIKAIPSRGQANSELFDFWRRILELPNLQLRLLTGSKERLKTILLSLD